MSTARNPRRGRHGLSIVELMVTVAIIGVIASAAAVSMRESPTPRAAREIQLVLTEARRLAVEGGPLRPDVSAALGVTARARIDFSHFGDTEQAELLVFAEDPNLPAGAWEIYKTYYLPANAQLVGVGTSMQSEPGGPAPPALPGGAPVILRFNADGTSDGGTVFLSDRRKAGGLEDPYRVLVAPLTGAVSVLKGW